ncbi:MAG: CusA/CzcA family heavy metal efflux RND transporter [Aquificaceae bacterium]|nr:CusA/CzcA family heavy metal efflux RND transporter [Aquificaceae bacterium]
MIRWVLNLRLLVLLVLLFSILYGFYSFLKLPIDTFPDPTPAQVVIYTETPGLSAEETELLVSKPIEAVMSGLKGAQLVRSISLPGLSYVSVFFAEGTDLYFARNLVAQKLLEVQGFLPQGLVPRMGPNTSGLGNVMFYALVDTGGKYSLEDLKAFQEWRVKPILKSVDGVEEISQWGPSKAYLVMVETSKMQQHGVGMLDIIRAVEDYSRSAGGGFLQSTEGDLVVRGVGRFQNPEDIKAVPIKKTPQGYILLGDVANVVEGEMFNRRGAFTLGGEEVQGNIILKRVGVNTMELVKNLKEAIRKAQDMLPEGVRIEILYDQAYLTEKAVRTIQKALLEGIMLVSLGITLYLWNPRVALLVSLSIPATLLITFILLNALGLSGNLMTLGGLAIGIGLFADATVVVVENIYRHLSEKRYANKLSLVIQSTSEVAKPVFFAISIIAVVFLPIFTFESVEGKYYKPLALTIILALLASLFVAFFYMPVLSLWFLKEGKEETRFFTIIKERYLKLLSVAFKIRPVLLGFAFLMFFMSLIMMARVGKEFAPQLEEGALLVKSFLSPNVSLEEAKRVAKLVENTALKYPEVIRTFSNIGRAEVGEPEDVSYIETFIILKPQAEWKSFKSRQEFEEKLRGSLEDTPGVEFSFTQPIQMRIDELLSGVKSTLAIKVFGEDLDTINQIAHSIEEIVSSTKGAVDVETEAQSGKLQLRIIPDREKLQLYSVSTQSIMGVLEYYFGGKEAGQLQRDTMLFPVVVSLAEKSPEVVRDIPLYNSEGAVIKLSDVAKVEMSEGYGKIRREDGMRYALVQSNLSGRDLGSFVEEVRRRINEEIKLPPGYSISFGGQFENQERAMKKLSVAVPTAILLIFLLLYLNYRSVRDSLMVILNVPFATVGGAFSLYLLGYNLSVPSAVGFIAVFGIATLNGVVLVSYIRNLMEEGVEKREAIMQACSRRLRPILITATATSLGLLPMLLTTDIGSEVQKPLASVVIGGIFTSTLLTLIILPLVYDAINRK